MKPFSQLQKTKSLKGLGLLGRVLNGQGVPVGVGQPTLKIDNLTVGGTAV